MRLRVDFLCVIVVCLLAGCKSASQTKATAPPVQETTDIPVPDSLKQAGAILTQELGKAGISGLNIRYNSYQPGSANTISFMVRSTAEKQDVDFASQLKNYNPEGYYIKASKSNVLFVGNSLLAVQHAVYDYLEQLGFRYYQPGAEWEIVPQISSPFIAYERLTQPMYEYRHMANGHGYNKSRKLIDNFFSWYRANRLGGFFQVMTGHSYQNIVTNNKEIFREHPEYFAGNVKKGELPPAAKFNVANPGLVAIVKKDAVWRINETRRLGGEPNMITMEPSDGGGFCNSPECLKIGNPSDQVFYLVNEVAKHLRKDYPGVWVGSLAYNEHILPVKFKLEPNVFVMVTNGFNRSKYSTNELLKLWKEKVSKVGVYEYLSVFEWDQDLPGRSNASQTDYLQKSIRDYYLSGARVYQGETTIGWQSKGLGQYITTKLLWDYRVNVDSIREDYFKKCFGEAAPEIKRLYQLWETAPWGFLGDNFLAECLEQLSVADRKVKNADIKKRLNHIKIYLHYLVLYKKLKANPTPAGMQAILSFANRTFETAAFATLPVMVSLANSTGYEPMGFYGKGDHTWKKDSRPLTDNEVNTLFQQDLVSVKRVEGLRTYAPVTRFETFDAGKLPAAQKSGKTDASFIGQTTFTLRILEKSASNSIEIKSGYSARPYQDLPVSVKIYDHALYQQIKKEADVIISDTQWSKVSAKTISLSSLSPGDYVVEVDDIQKIFNIRFQGKMLYNVLMSSDKILETSSVTGLNTYYFVVSRDVKKIIVHKAKSLRLRSPSGRVVDLADNKMGDYTVDILANEAGTWQVFYQAGSMFIEGVPPYLGIDPNKMLLPSYN